MVCMTYREKIDMKKGTIAFVAAVIGGITGIVGGSVNVYRREKQKLNVETMTIRKDDAILKAYSYWLQRKQQGESLVDYFERNGYKRIAIYGIHYLGQSLLSELENSTVEVVCAIDKHADLRYTEIPLYTPDKDIPEVDAVIVTAFFFFEEIKKTLQGKVSCPLVSIEDIIYL